MRTKLSPRQLLGHFRQLLPADLLAGWLGLDCHHFYQRALTPLITLWYLVFQHLHPDHTLGAALADAHAGGADDQCHLDYSRQPVAGRLLSVRVRRPGHRSQVLYLFTTLTDRQTYSVEALVRLYAARWHIELNLRHVKQQLELGALECKSAQMAQKEWLAGLMAYNLIRAVMVAAAALTQVPVTLLSFNRTRQLLLRWLVRWGWQANANALPWETLLKQAA